MIKLIECPRDAMQGIHPFIPTEAKAAYINSLLKVGFDTLDFGSFVSPKAIPQMQDTAQVLNKLDLSSTKTKLLAIIANPRGAEDALKHAQISYLGYPFSISETFQQRNTNRGIAEAYEDVKHIQEACMKSGKQLVLYFSMGFGNPYGDPWNAEVVEEWLAKLLKEDIRIFSLADTVGTADPKDIRYLFSSLIKNYPQLEIGAHFHARPDQQLEKIAAAYENGCKRFDSAMLGFGGCPMAKDELVGNTSTDFLVSYLQGKNEQLGIDKDKFGEARAQAQQLFALYH